MSAPHFSVRQNVLVNLLFVLFMLGGLIVLTRLPVDFFPDISFNMAQITTVWTGASADEIERLVTTKIEDEIKIVSGIKEMRSTSAADMSQIEVEWDETLSDDEYDRALADMRAALDRVEDLPEEAEEPELRELSVAEVYASVMVAVVDEGGVGERALRAVARDLKDRIADLPGVRRAKEHGIRDREIRVYVDRSRLIGADLTLPDIREIIWRNNRNVPAGSFTGARGETTIRATGDFTTPAELAATVVKKNPDGTHIRLDELARVEEGFEKRRSISRYNGRPSAVLHIAKESDADLFEVVGRLEKLLADHRSQLPDGVRAIMTLDASSYIAQRLRMLRNNLIVGVGIVLGILWFTLGFRNALLAVIAIPFCYLTAVMVFPMLDISINAISIVGMILVSGMLVDDAIIVLENIYRHIEEGRPLLDAIITGTEEVLWPVIGAVATTVAAFTPLLLVTGTSGEFMSILPKTVIVCLLASLLECLFTLPAHYLHLGSRGHRDAAVSAPGAWGAVRRWSDATRLAVDRRLDRFRQWYAGAIQVVLANRLTFAALLGGLVIFAAGVAWRLPVDLFAGEYNIVLLSVYAPTSYGIDRTDAVMKEIEDVLAEFGPDDILDYSTFVGMAMNPDMLPMMGSHLGIVHITLADTRVNREHPERILQRIKDRADEWWAANSGKADNVLTLPPRNGPPVGKPVAVQIRADDYRKAKEISGEMKAFLGRLPGVYNVEDNMLPGPRELRLTMDETRASIYGLTFQDLATALRGANEGLVASTFKSPSANEDIDIRVLYEDRYRQAESDLLDTEVRTPRGQRIKLGDVAEVEFDRGFLALTHHDARRSVIVYADVMEGVTTSESVNRVLQEHFADLPVRYPEVEVAYGGEFEKTRQAFADMYRIFPLAVLLIYVILAAEFRSYLQPLIVMTAVPFGIVGVIFGLAIFGFPISFAILYAVVGLSGVVVNDSLVLVDFANRSRARGVPLLEAVVDAGRKRLRPVLLTTLTTVGALLPTALGLFGRSLNFGPFAASFAAGLSLGTVFTLFVVPAGYYTLAELLERQRAPVSATRQEWAARG